jgi:hypothetical protein
MSTSLPSRPVVIRGWLKKLAAGVVVAVALSAAALSGAVPATGADPAARPSATRSEPGQRSGAVLTGVRRG